MELVTILSVEPLSGRASLHNWFNYGCEYTRVLIKLRGGGFRIIETQFPFLFLCG